MKKPIIKYTPHTCGLCKQTTEYLLPIDSGTIRIVKQIAKFIGQKGINAVHPRKEMEGTWLSSNEVGNLSRARFHGLIARIPNEKGNYVLTRKASEFLHGKPIPRFAIVSKVTGHNAGYYDIEGRLEMVTIHSFEEEKISGSGLVSDYWEGIDYRIEEGRIIKNT